MPKSEIIRIFMIILGYPIGGPSKPRNIYCVTVVMTITGVYLWVRFLRKYFVTTSSVNVYDKFQLVSMVSTPAVLAIMVMNCYHLFRLITRHRVFSKLFRNGRVLGVFGGFDVVIMSLSTFVFIPHLMRSNLPLIDRVRFVLYGPIVNLNFFIAFQFCAILKYQTAKLFHLAELMRTHFEGTKIKPQKLAVWCIERHEAVVSEVFKSLEEFSIQMFSVICFLMVDMIQFSAYTIERLIEEEMPPLLKFTYFYMGSMRWVMVTYINSHFHGIEKQGDYFNQQLFHLMKEKNELCYDKRLTLYLTRKERIVLTACGFFTYGYPLMISIIGAVATNLVVLLQFSLMK